jgi:benzodiazapine receptor
MVRAPSVPDSPRDSQGHRWPVGRVAGWRWFVLALWLVLCVGGGAFVGLQTSGGADPWYVELRKPVFNPPAWVFAPVWLGLYTMMAIAAWKVWLRGGWAAQRVPLTVFVLQLTANFAWSYLFFGAHLIDLALVDIVFLWFMILLTTRQFVPVDRQTAWLLAPYLSWVTFAAVLNLSFAVLN